MPGAVTWLLMALTAGAVAAEVWGVWHWRLAIRSRRGDAGSAAGSTSDRSWTTAGWGPAGVVALVGAGALAVLGFEMATDGQWRPLASHLHGLLLLSALLAGAIVFLWLRTRLTGLTLLATPVLAFFLLWAVCASWWTFRLFELNAVVAAWSWLHLGGVYAGTAAAVLAATGGVAYLWAQRSLRRHQGGPKLLGLGSLERLERWTADAASLGFVLLTVGLVSGLVILAETPGAIGGGVWGWVKVGLASVAWATYAAAMFTRRSEIMRGSRGAWLAIGGFVLLVVVYGIVVSLPSTPTGGGS
ncbi:MAG: cytochrome c biogenesis protein CcsA [Planctomycetota bacterium]